MRDRLLPLIMTFRKMQRLHYSLGEVKPMYAIIQSGGKQYRVQQGQTLKLEKLEGQAGNQVGFDNVLMLVNNDDVHVGTPYVDNAKVVAEVLSQGRSKKVHVIKFKRRKHQMKQAGHRQAYTEVKITDLILGGKKLEPPKTEVSAKPAGKNAKAAKKKTPAKAKTKTKLAQKEPKAKPAKKE